MGATTDDTKALVDQIKDQQQVLAAAQARQASLMLKFSNTRRHLDQQRITYMRNEGADPRYTPGEFAALEIGLATTTNSRKISRTIGIARRLHDETPDAWDAWQAGHIDHDRAARINKALIRLTRDTSKQLLNALVVDVATRTTVEILGRWLNEFVARVEPDQTNDRLRRSLDDRYVSIRPDIDGISFLNAAIASADADAINQVLDALAAIAEPGDTRTFKQRRADACTELLLGKISNGCHVSWQDDPEEDEADDDEGDEPRDNDNNPGTDHTDTGDDVDPADPSTDQNSNDDENYDDDDRPWDTDADWDLPASAFRPDPHAPPPDPPDDAEPPDDPPDKPPTGAGPQPNRNGRPLITPCPHDHHTRPIPATIGVIITAQSLLGYTNTPGQLTDRSTLIPADLIRDLARQPGTLFHRLLTDEQGNLLDVTELGRFPSRKLGTALDYRDGTCNTPICTTPAHKCDHDHVIPVPDGPTTAANLQTTADPNTAPKPTPDTTTHATYTPLPGPPRPATNTPPPTNHSPSNNGPPKKGRMSKDRSRKRRTKNCPAQNPKRNDADLALPLVKQANRLDDSSFPRLSGLRTLDRQDMTQLVAVGKAVEELLCRGISAQCHRKIVGDGHLAWRGVELEVHINLVAGGYSRAGSVFPANRQHELSTHRGHRAAVGVPAVQGHGHGRLLAGAKTGDNIGRNLESGRRFAGEQEGAAESHARQYAKRLKIRQNGQQSRRDEFLPAQRSYRMSVVDGHPNGRRPGCADDRHRLERSGRRATADPIRAGVADTGRGDRSHCARLPDALRRDAVARRPGCRRIRRGRTRDNHCAAAPLPIRRHVVADRLAIALPAQPGGRTGGAQGNFAASRQRRTTTGRIGARRWRAPHPSGARLRKAAHEHRDPAFAGTRSPRSCPGPAGPTPHRWTPESP